jgi:hypothetical protein
MVKALFGWQREGEAFVSPFTAAMPRRIPLLRIFVYVCLFALLLSACEFGTNSPASGTGSSTPGPVGEAVASQPPAVSTVVVSPVPSISYTSAWGAQVPVDLISLEIGRDYFLIPQSVTPDGRFLLATSNFYDRTGGPLVTPTKLVMIGVGDHQATEIRATSPGDTQLYEANADDNWIVWTEAPKEPGFYSDWIIYAYNRSDRSLKKIAKAPRNKDGLPALGSDGSASVERGMAVWSEAVPDTGDSPASVVKLADLATGEVKTLGENGYIPTISWPNVAWLEVQGQQSQGQQSGDTRITVLNLETGAKKVLTKPQMPSGFAMRNGSIAWITQKSDRLILTDLDETFEQTIVTARGTELLEAPYINDRLITWSGEGRTQVWDRKLNALVTLTTGVVTRHFVSARNLVWITPLGPGPEDPKNIDVLDTTLLP